MATFQTYSSTRMVRAVGRAYEDALHAPLIPGEDLYCTLCKNLDFSFDSLYQYKASVGEVFDVTLTVKELARSAERGCAACGILWRGVHELTCDIESALNPKYPEELAKIYVFVPTRPGLPLRVSVSLFEGGHRIEYYTLEGSPSPWSAFGSRRQISPFAGSDACHNLLQTWLDECARDHEACATPLETPLPTRVLDIGHAGNDPIQLYETKDELGRYAALSHCWGKKRPLTTTKATIQARKADIAWNSIPKTFQDAISIARKLHIQYLWIDSLCIIQDDATDWNVEAGRMMEVYANAYVTIAATWSSNGEQGCLSSRPVPDVVVWPPPGTDSDSDYSGFSEIFARPEVDHSDMHKQPLCTRAWTLQEHTLSRRVIHFLPTEVRWDCREGHACECTPGKMSEARQFYSQRFNGTTPEMMNMLPQPRHDAWHMVVVEYSSRNLTVTSDKLPAMSGLAKAFEGPDMGRYLAGLWEHDIISSLLWTVKYDNPVLAQRAPTYRAPSWSWASIDGPIEYVESRVAIACDENLRCRVLGAEVQTAGGDPHGQVTSCYIRIYGMVMKATLRVGTAMKTYHKNPDGSTDVTWKRGVIERLHEQHTFEADTCIKDSASTKMQCRLQKRPLMGSVSKGSPIICLQLAAGIAHGYQPRKSWALALVLKPSNRVASAYERIGLISVEENWNWFIDNSNHAKLIEITIV